MDFNERERYRDILRLKFSINKFIQNMNNASYCMYLFLVSFNVEDVIFEILKKSKIHWWFLTLFNLKL